MLSIFLLTLTGLAAGAVNAIAGGGTLLSFPMLVWLGVPPIMANATATLTALPGYISSTFAYRKDIEAEGSLSLRAIIFASAVGGLVGAGLLLVTSEDAFVGIVPWLLLTATALFWAGPRLVKRAQAAGRGPVGAVVSGAAIALVSAYGGYFNGGLGIMLLAVFGLIGFRDLHGMNGLKNLLSAILSVVSVATFAAAGLIAWEPALVLGLATTLGGYLGARLARRIERTALLRGAIVTIGLVLTVVFFVL